MLNALRGKTLLSSVKCVLHEHGSACKQLFSYLMYFS